MSWVGKCVRCTHVICGTCIFMLIHVAHFIILFGHDQLVYFIVIVDRLTDRVEYPSGERALWNFN